MNANFKQLAEEIKSIMNQFEGGHDFTHIERVLRNAKNIHEHEGGDWEVVSLACLLHDVGDAKLTGSEDTLISRPTELLEKYGVDIAIKEKVLDIIGSMSFSSRKEVTTLEGKIVQDADRLEAIGAIGVARTFSYGGKKGRPLWIPEEEVLEKFESSESYHKRAASSLTHFDEKLFKLKDLMNTTKGKQMALQRDEFMHTFYQQFKDEWFGKV